MAADVTAAVDEIAANLLLHDAEAALGTLSSSDSGSLGPFGASWGASVSFSGGAVTLMAPDTVSIDNLDISYSLNLSLSIDLSFLDFCIPQICIWTPFGDLCTPKICFSFPTLSVPLSFASSAFLSADFGIDVHLTSGTWDVDVVIQDVRNLDLGGAATALVTAIGSAVALALLAVPFIGPILAAAVGIITAAFGIAEVTGLLGTILSPFVSGLSFTVYQQPQTFVAVPAAGPFDPDVDVTLTAVAASVQSTDKNELVLTVDI